MVKKLAKGMRLTGESGGVGQTLMYVNTLLPAFFTLASHRGGFDFFLQCSMIRGWASLVGVVEQQQPEGGMHTGELAAAVLVATSTHMDLTGVTACWPVLTGIQRRYEKVITRAGL